MLGQADSSKYNVFMDLKQPDVMVNEIALVRIAHITQSAKQNNRVA